MKALTRRTFVYTFLALAGTALTSGLDFLRGRKAQAVSNPGLPDVENQSDTQTAPKFRPTYLELHKSGELKRRAMALWKRMESCDLCPRQCGINRIEGDEGYCQATSRLEISSFHPHFGEERPLVGTGGSGTIFMTNCGLRCVFCINWEISWGGRGKAVDVEKMVEMMLLLQKRACYNINFVSKYI